MQNQRIISAECANPCSSGEMLLDPAGAPRQCGPVSPCPSSYWCHVGTIAETTVCCSAGLPPYDICKLLNKKFQSKILACYRKPKAMAMLRVLDGISALLIGNAWVLFIMVLVEIKIISWRAMSVVKHVQLLKIPVGMGNRSLSTIDQSCVVQAKDVRAPTFAILAHPKWITIVVPKVI